MASHFNIIQRLHGHATKQAQRLALVQSGEDQNNQDTTLTYGELKALTQGYANFFARHGVQANEHVLLLLPLSTDFYAVFLALMQLGCTVMLIDPGVGKQHVKACLQMLKPDVLIGTPKAQLLRLYPELRHQLKAFCTGVFPFAHKIKPDQKDHPQNVPTYAATKDHPALITFTSGSTGRPKAIVRTHGFLLEQGDALARLMQAPPNTVEFCSFPVFVLSNLSQGITTLLPPTGTKSLNTANFSSIAKNIEKYQASRLLAAPDFCNQLALTPDAQKALRSVEHVHTGGGPVHMNVFFNLKRAMPQATIMALYGSTEAEPIALQNLSTMSELDIERVAHGAGLPAGKPVDIVNLRIIENHTGNPIPVLSQEAFQHMSLQEEQTGEIVVTGPLVQKGYMNAADNLQTKFEVDGEIWHRTGDAGYLDKKGMLWLQGRSNTNIAIDGQWVYPFAVEATAAMYTHIKRAAFVQVESKNILALEGECLPKQTENMLKEIFPYLNTITYLYNIPVDKRHHSKILYPELKTLLMSNHSPRDLKD